MKGDTWVYVGLGLGAVGLVVTVVGLGEKVTLTLPSNFGLGLQLRP